MLFITNRTMFNQTETLMFNREGKLSFIIDDNRASQDVYFCDRAEKDRYLEIGNKDFFTQLKNHKAKEILFYIHGYSNLPEPDIFPRAFKLQSMFDEIEKDWVVVIPLIWPCDNDFGVLKDYWDDQKSADASAFAFSRVFAKFMEWGNSEDNIKNPCMKRINVLAHSMGNRVLRESVKLWAKYDMNYKLPILFRNTFLVAADMVNETLEKGQSGNLLCQCSRNVVVYHASDDFALRASKITNLKNRIASRRLGHTGPEDMNKVPKNVFSVDCDDVNTKYDFPTGHSYFLDYKGKRGEVFDHIQWSIKSGRIMCIGGSVKLDLDGVRSLQITY